jgi:hypothetical protein
MISGSQPKSITIGQDFKLELSIRPVGLLPGFRPYKEGEMNSENIVTIRHL